MLLLICTVNHSAFGLLTGDTLHYVCVCCIWCTFVGNGRKGNVMLFSYFFLVFNQLSCRKSS